MRCLICSTEIKKRDGFYWQYENPDDEESEGGVHDDCLIRECEFAGESVKADSIFMESDQYYIKKTLPKG